VAEKDYESTRILGRLLHAVMGSQQGAEELSRLWPDETASNRLGDVIHRDGKEWMAATLPVDENLSQTGRVWKS